MKTTFEGRARARKLQFMAGGAVAALLACSTPAWADAAPTQPVADVPAGEIIVTAQKRSESAVKVPISITALNADALANAGVTNVTDLTSAIPALRVNLAGTFVLPTIRGIGSMVALPGLTQNIATYVDGFYVPSPAADNFDLVNISSVEVLKGPQGTLFGANAVGGAIQINTLKPKSKFSGLIRAGYGSYGDVNGAIYMTGGLMQGVSADIAASIDHGNGWFTNIADNNHNIGRYTKWSVRPQLLIEPSDGVKVLLAYAHDHDNDPTSQMVVAYNGYSMAPAVNLAEGLTTSLGQTQVAFGDPHKVSLDPRGPGYAIRNSNAWTMRADIGVGFANLALLTAYRTDNVAQGLDYTSANPNPIAQYRTWTDHAKTFTQEVNLTSKTSDKLTWVVGAFFLDYRNAYDYNTDLAPSSTFTLNIFKSHNHSQTYSAYADATYEVIDHLFLTYGGRYVEDHFRRDYEGNAGFGLDSESSPTLKFTNYSQRAVARYEITPRSNVYASFSQGYRSGGLSGSMFFTNTPVRPEKLDAYEVGFKTSQGALRLNVAGFFYDYRDIQVTAYGINGAAVVVNAGRAHIYGLDGDLTYRVSPDLTVGIAGTLINAKYTSFGGYQPNGAGGFNCVGCAYETFYTGAGTDAASIAAGGGYPQGPGVATGNSVERTPPFAGNLDVTYGLDLAGGRLKLNANVLYTDGYWLDALHHIRNPAYGQLNLRATWTDASKHIDLAVFGKNVTTAKYFVGISADPSSARVTYAAPALFGGQVTYHF